jgi:hypothetical protein
MDADDVEYDDYSDRAAANGRMAIENSRRSGKDR